MTASAPSPSFLVRTDSPIGRLELSSDGANVTRLVIASNGTLPRDGEPERGNRVLERAVQQLEQYFSGRRRKFRLPLQLTGTAFQQAIWNRLLELEHGEVISYGTLGAAAGRAGSGRAVGTAVRSNPVQIIVPCHRVLSTAGTVIGYSGGQGIPTKLWLLAHEGVLLPQPA
ncbi:methylated-DNA--[protein]-cysteine S-methyltransferase [Cryobacterium sp. BB736]|uniref:methylated-DNA--[protein]-cysteine S-methyltransferase n=1 Tax=Cryobacterium sp. BB736 TaxID=2746963 RepID=UPI001875C860|nr:methylated-DNA--[protein]-cysteine S-methyltransferase [Cryobacterium sp. BB736]